MQITQKRRLRLQAFAAQFLLGIAGLALITFVCFRIGFGPMRTSFAYVVLIALVSLLGSFSASVVLSIVAVACLNYFFVPPLFDFRVDDPDDIVRLAVFFTTSLVVTTLTTKLRASQVRFRTFVDHATDAFLLLDDDWTVLDVNRRACDGLGYSRQELIGRHKSEFDVGLDDASIQRLKQRMVAGEAITFETRHRRKDGTSFPVEVRVGPFEQGGRRYLCLVRDISERRRADERLRQLESDLAHVNRVSMMGELMASLAHEILHPIATARNNARAAMRFLDMNPPNMAEVGEALACIVRDADRGKNIVDRIRDHIKKAPPRNDRFDLNEAIQEVIEMVRAPIEKNRVSVRTRLAAGLTSVWGDRVQLQQVVLNLILNAIEAMGSVEERGRMLSIRTAQRGAAGILVAVHDSGPGVAPEHLQRVFEPFYTTKNSGLGMGLSICRSIIDAHGGRLWADADQPRGTVFQFTLPAAQEGSSLQADYRIGEHNEDNARDGRHPPAC